MEDPQGSRYSDRVSYLSCFLQNNADWPFTTPTLSLLRHSPFSFYLASSFTLLPRGIPGVPHLIVSPHCDEFLVSLPWQSTAFPLFPLIPMTLGHWPKFAPLALSPVGTPCDSWWAVLGPNVLWIRPALSLSSRTLTQGVFTASITKTGPEHFVSSAPLATFGLRCNLLPP